MVERSVLNGGRPSSATADTDAQIQILCADVEELERMVTTLQTMHVRPATTATDKLPVAMDRLHGLMASVPSPPLGWSTWHSNSLQLALDDGDTETISRLTDLLEILARGNQYLRTS